jgi:signal transduction histidine kinase
MNTEEERSQARAARGETDPMRAPRVPLLAWSLWAVALGLVGGVAILSYLDRSTMDAATGGLYLIMSLSAIGFGTSGALVAARHRRNAIGWLFLMMAIGFAAGEFALEYAVRGLAVAPGSLPAVAWIAYPINYLFPMSFALMVMVFQLFPDGRPVSARWRILTRVTVALTLSGLIGSIFADTTTVGDAGRLDTFHAWVSNPLGIHALRGMSRVGSLVGLTGLFAVGVASVVSLIRRWRRSTGEERQQIKWLGFVGASAAATLALFPIGLVTDNPIVWAVFWWSFTPLLCLGIPIASAVAILKYRLYDIDVVINKTVVFGALAAFITGVYVAVVVGLGAAFGAGSKRPNLALSIAATAIVAIAFGPVRERIQRFANRVVYGVRATPYEVLSAFSERMGAAMEPNELLSRMVRVLAEGTGAQRATVWLVVGDALKPEANVPAEEPPPARVTLNGDVPRIHEATLTLPVYHRGELLGALSLLKPRGERLTPTEDKLARDLGAQAGLVLHNVRLTEELLARMEEIRASRARIVAAQDTERRRLERNIHDGAQQELVALAVKLRLAHGLMAKDPARAGDMLEQVQHAAGGALETLRDLARGIYPPLLAKSGLGVALAEQATKAAIPVAVDAAGLGRYSQDEEAAVYFCCLEALQNVAKYASASRADITLREDGGVLSFAVRDDGVGFDPADARHGSGLQGMADRLAALGGRVELSSTPGGGTVVTGSLPARRRFEAMT